jgi:hypothetical protein
MGYSQMNERYVEFIILISGISFIIPSYPDSAECSLLLGNPVWLSKMIFTFHYLLLMPSIKHKYIVLD